jgi:hypothetical protein
MSETREQCYYHFTQGKRKGERCKIIVKKVGRKLCARHKNKKITEPQNIQVVVEKVEEIAEKVEEVVENVVEDKINDIIEEKLEEKLEEIAEVAPEPAQEPAPEPKPDEEISLSDFKQEYGTPDPEKKDDIPMEMSGGISPEIQKALKSIKWEKFKKSMMDFNHDTGRSCVIFGSSYSGKTHFLLNNIIPNYCDKKRITLLQADNVQSATYRNLPKQIIRVDAYMPEIIRAMKYINSRGKKKNKYSFMSITDDIVVGLRHNDVIRKCLLSWRNSKISSVNLFQSLSLINKSERSSISYIVLKQINDLNTVRDLIDWYLLQSKDFYDLKMADRLVLYRRIMDDKSNAILIDNIKGKIRFIKHK